MRHGSLFSGIGGFDLAAEWMGWKNIFHCEKDAKARAVLHKNFPDVESHEDIFKLDAKKYHGKIDIITGGFPCQPFSVAGKRKGETDDRYLWPEMLRIIREVKPSFVIGENVNGILTMENGKTLEDICSSLETEGYTVETFNIPAASVQAWHKRERIWIIAYSDKISDNAIEGGHRKKSSLSKIDRKEICGRESIRADSKLNSYIRQERIQGRFYQPLPAFKGIQRCEDGRIYANIEGRPLVSTPVLCRSDDGIPNRMERTGQYGNAIVPQVAYEIFKVIEQVQEHI